MAESLTEISTWSKTGSVVAKLQSFLSQCSSCNTEKADNKQTCSHRWLCPGCAQREGPCSKCASLNGHVQTDAGVAQVRSAAQEITKLLKLKSQMQISNGGVEEDEQSEASKIGKAKKSPYFGRSVDEDQRTNLQQSLRTPQKQHPRKSYLSAFSVDECSPKRKQATLSSGTPSVRLVKIAKSTVTRSSSDEQQPTGGGSGRRGSGSKSTEPSYMKRNAKGETLLHLAAKVGDMGKVEELISLGADPNVTDNAGWSPLHEACNAGHLSIARKLLEDGGAYVDFVGYLNQTPLHDAVKNGREAVVRILLHEFGADPTLKDAFGKTPQDYASLDQMYQLLKEENYRRAESQELMRTRVAKEVTGWEKVPILVHPLADLNVKQLENVVSSSEGRFQLAASLSVATHVISAQRLVPRTEAYLLALQSGKWILEETWLTKCSEAFSSSTDLPLCPTYECIGSTLNPDSNAPQRAREALKRRYQPPFLNLMEFYLHRSIRQKPSDEEDLANVRTLTRLIEAGGGKLLKREPDPDESTNGTMPFHAFGTPVEGCSTFLLYQPGDRAPRIKYNMKHFKVLPVEWLLQSIDRFEFQEPEFYLEASVE